MIIDFKINHQRMERTDNNYLVNMSSNYLQARFSFDTEDWTGLNKYVTFNTKSDNYRYPLNNENSMLNVPNKLLKDKYFHVKAYGHDPSDELLITTNDVTVILDTADSDPLTGLPTNESMEDMVNWLADKVNAKVDRFEVHGRRIICYKGKDIVQVIPVNDESLMNLLNEPFIDIDTGKLTTEGMVFYRRHNL